MTKTYFFWLGYIVHLAWVNMVQDFVGKEKYIELVKVGWVDTSPYVWPMLVVVVLAFGLVTEWVDVQGSLLSYLRARAAERVLNKIEKKENDNAG